MGGNNDFWQMLSISSLQIFCTCSIGLCVIFSCISSFLLFWIKYLLWVPIMGTSSLVFLFFFSFELSTYYGYNFYIIHMFCKSAPQYFIFLRMFFEGRFFSLFLFVCLFFVFLGLHLRHMKFHSNTGFELHLRPTPQLMAMVDP